MKELYEIFKFEIKVSILPQSAIVSVGNARVIIGEGNESKIKIIKLSSISKYPYLKIQKSVEDFGNVLIGKTVENEIILANLEKVPANFIIKGKKLNDAKIIEEFSLSEFSGTIPPNAQYLIKIKYNNYANQYSYDTFEIFTRKYDSIFMYCEFIRC
jgi:hypothetical protein